MDHTKNETPESEPASAAPVAAAPVGSTRRTIREKPEGLLPKILRVTALMLVLGAGFAFFGYQRVQGQLSEALLQAGPQMMMLADAEHQDAPRELVLNGQHVRFSSGIAPYSPTEVLNRFEQRCEDVDADLMAQFSEIIAEQPDSEGAHRLELLSPVMRQQTSNHGYVACFDLGHERAALNTIVERYQAFARSRDLHDFGDLRYVYAEPAGEGSTHFVAIWTEGSLRFDELFPETGDARGVDPANIPRPPGARRVLTAAEHGVADVATIYEGSELDEGQLESFYRRELPGEGWRILDGEAYRSSVAGGAATPAAMRDIRPALVAQRGDRTVFFSLTTDFEGRGRAAVLTSGDPLEGPSAAAASGAGGS